MNLINFIQDKTLIDLPLCDEPNFKYELEKYFKNIIAYWVIMTRFYYILCLQFHTKYLLMFSYLDIRT